MIRSRVPARRWGYVAAMTLALACATAIAAPSYADPLPTGTDVDFQLGGDRSVSPTGVRRWC